MAEAWRPGTVRLFISHLAVHAEEVTLLAEALDVYGFSSFVAHRTIEVSLPWREEIERGLASCDCLLAVVHPGFHDSKWTDQEIGWALGRGVPTVVLLYPGADLQGFLEKYQAIVVTGPVDRLAPRLVQIFQSVGLEDRVIDALVEALGSATSYVAAGAVADMLNAFGDELRRSDMSAILRSFELNDQVNEAILVRRPLRELIERRAPDLLEKFWPSGP